MMTKAQILEGFSLQLLTTHILSDAFLVDDQVWCCDHGCS